MASDDRIEVLRATAVHFAVDHDEPGPALIEGKDFLLEPAPYRCDLCGVAVELPAWEYETLPGVAEDPLWVVCDPCGGLVEAGTQIRLFRRVVAVQSSTFAMTKDEAMASIPMARRFLESRIGQPRRITHEGQL